MNSKRQLSDQELIDLRNDLQSDSLFMLIIDEISNVSPSFLQIVSNRLQQIRNCSKPFGGLAVLLVGDFLQKKPPGATPLINGLMYLAVTEDIQEKRSTSAFTPKFNFPYSESKPEGLTDIISNTSLGLKLFKKFTVNKS